MFRRRTLTTVAISWGALMMVIPQASAQAPAPAADWVPTPATYPARLSQLEKWTAQILGPEPTTESRARLRSEILKLAKRDAAPSWITKGSWKEMRGKEELWLGVGMVSGIKNQSLALTTAENRARAELAKMQSMDIAVSEKDGIRTVKSLSAATLSGVQVIDWYISPKDEFFALAALHLPEGPK